jgi:hypothetical protein
VSPSCPVSALSPDCRVRPVTPLGGLYRVRVDATTLDWADGRSVDPMRQNAPIGSSGPTHPHHRVRWAPEADRPPSGRLPPPIGNATTRRFLPASSGSAPPRQPSSSARQKGTHRPSRPVRTAHPL